MSYPRFVAVFVAAGVVLGAVVGVVREMRTVRR